MLKINDRVRVVQSPNVILRESAGDLGRLGVILGIDHPSAGIAGALTVVLDPWHNGLEEKQPRVLRFLDKSQVEPV